VDKPPVAFRNKRGYASAFALSNRRLPRKIVGIPEGYFPYEHFNNFGAPTFIWYFPLG
jgi:hypothetical protein